MKIREIEESGPKYSYGGPSADGNPSRSSGHGSHRGASTRNILTPEQRREADAAFEPQSARTAAVSAAERRDYEKWLYFNVDQYGNPKHNTRSSGRSHEAADGQARQAQPRSNQHVEGAVKILAFAGTVIFVLLVIGFLLIGH